LDGLKIAYKKKVVNAPKEMKETWRTLISLADSMGFHHGLKTWKDLCKKTEASINRDSNVNTI
jgi:hypothetical protein